MCMLAAAARQSVAAVWEGAHLRLVGVRMRAAGIGAKPSFYGKVPLALQFAQPGPSRKDPQRGKERGQPYAVKLQDCDQGVAQGGIAALHKLGKLCCHCLKQHGQGQHALAVIEGRHGDL